MTIDVCAIVTGTLTKVHPIDWLSRTKRVSLSKTVTVVSTPRGPDVFALENVQNPFAVSTGENIVNLKRDVVPFTDCDTDTVEPQEDAERMIFTTTTSFSVSRTSCVPHVLT